MLTASSSAPNSQQQIPVNSISRPTNWRGVAEGMIVAKKAVASGQLEQAEQLLLELLEFAPAETRAWKLLAKTQRKLGYIEAGIKSAKRALKLQNAPVNRGTPASLTIAQLLWQQGEYGEARSMLELLLSGQPENEQLQNLQRQWSNEVTE
jgi:predicted Zn-dependent protease